MQSYQFIKYNSKTKPEHLLKYAQTEAVLCFDFEDSIADWINPLNNSERKQQYRNYFKHICNTIIPQLSTIKIGIRINNTIPELKKDLCALSTLRINSILIPKVETPNQIEVIEQLLSDHKVFCEELIPIIETPKGVSNLSEIIDSGSHKITKVGFGHCDYNLSINIFPFFHQNSKEYWKWISKISDILIPKNISLINSAYLALANDSFFNSMLNHLYTLFGENAGQFTLTSKQSVFCKTFNHSNNKIPFHQLFDERLDLSIEEQYAAELITKFETENNNNGFTVSKADRTLISPHEYIAAKSHYKNKRPATINFTFVGGCFPVQHNIVFEDLFHQKLKRTIEDSFNVNFNVNIIRYERINTCLSKIITYHQTNPVDILVLHIRPEPFLRLVKFFYKYLNNDGKLKYSLNIPLLKLINPEKYDMLILGRRFNYPFKPDNSTIHKINVDLNYKTGKILGNIKYAIDKYYKLILDVVNYCQDQNIKLVMLGPALRTNTSYEPILCRRLNDTLKNKLKNKAITFVDGLDECSGNHEQLFQDNGIHATEHYHQLIAERLYNKLNKEIETAAKPGANTNRQDQTKENTSR